jgi:Family of unknown function (DUF6599)
MLAFREKGLWTTERADEPIPEPSFDFWPRVCYHYLFMRQRIAVSEPARLKPRRLVLCLTLILSAAGVAMAQSLEKLCSVLPAEVSGWKKSDPPQIYDKSNLFDYIDGGAELYNSYNFQKLLAVRYQASGDEEIVIDMFDMGNSFNAFGLFSHGREREDGLAGQGSEYNSGLLTFWKDRFYVSILAYPETEAKKEIVLGLGRSLADAVPAEGALPPVIGLLPRTNLVPESVRYFHHYIWLNSHFFVSNQNILLIDDEIQVVLAKYKTDTKPLHLLIALYPDEAKAGEAGKSFLRSYLPDASEGMSRLPDGRWTACRVEGNRLSIVFSAPSREVSASYLGMIGTGGPPDK